jgi:hypothetical protein
VNRSFQFSNYLVKHNIFTIEEIFFFLATPRTRLAM